MRSAAERRWHTATPAVLLTAVTLTMFALIPLLDPLDGSAPASEDDGPLGLLWLLAWLGFPLVGGFLAFRRPRHPIGWVLLGITFWITVAIASESVAIRHAMEGSVPLGTLGTWLTFFSGAPAFILVPFLVLLFPSGRIQSEVWRRLAAAAGVVGVLEVVLLAMVPESQPQGVPLVNPLGVPALEDALGILVPTLGIMLGGFGVAVVAHAVLRFRRSQGVERQQFRWFARAAVVFPIGMGLAIALGPVVPVDVLDGLVAVTFFVSFNGMALAIGVAVTRYRLYDIDRVVSKTVSYSVLTAILVGVYVLGVLGVGALLPGERSDLLVAGSTLLVAALFRPLRSRIQALMDRRFNRSRYDAAQTLEAFSSRLRDEVDLETLSGEMTDLAAATFQPRTAGVWLPEQATT